jgi:hypothetical protein
MSKVPKDKRPKNEVPAPGTYKTNLGDIDYQLEAEVETDPDLIINRPGFGSGVDRFREPAVDPYEAYEEEIAEMPRKKKERPTLPREPRFKETLVEAVGPGEYERVDEWNKKSYNILFAMMATDK